MENKGILKIAQTLFNVSVLNPADKSQFVNDYLQDKQYFENKESWQDRLWKFAKLQKLPAGWDARKLCNFVFDNREFFEKKSN